MTARLLILLLLLTPLWAGAELYKHVDEQGRVTYTDKPSKAEEEGFTPADTVNDVQMPKAPPPGSVIKRPSPAPAPAPEASRYKSLRIVTPAHDTVVRDNQGNVTVDVRLEPPLKTGEGHQLVVYLDGEVAEKFKTDSVILHNVDRGTHEIFVVVQDRTGKPLVSAKKLSFHLKRAAGG